MIAAYGTSMLTQVGLSELGIDESLDDGPVLPRAERIEEVQALATPLCCSALLTKILTTAVPCRPPTAPTQ